MLKLDTPSQRFLQVLAVIDGQSGQSEVGKSKAPYLGKICAQIDRNSGKAVDVCIDRIEGNPADMLYG